MPAFDDLPLWLACLFHVVAGRSHNITKALLLSCTVLSYFSTLMDPTVHPQITLGSDMLLPQLQLETAEHWEGIKQAWRLIFLFDSFSPFQWICLTLETALVACPLTGLRGDTSSPGQTCIRRNSPFLYVLVLPASGWGRAQLRFQFDCRAALWG